MTKTILHGFDPSISPDGLYPYGDLIQGIDGSFYGTTYEGGTLGEGTAYRITASRSSATGTTLHNFGGRKDGAFSWSGLMQGSDGNFYGTTPSGRAYGDGTVFQLAISGTSGTLATVSAFGVTAHDGFNPVAGLIQARDGNLYGTTESGGTDGGGTVFETVPWVLGAARLSWLRSPCTVALDQKRPSC